MNYTLIYVIIGLVYYSYNLVVRKLHLKNENSEGWILVPFWVFLWPLCFIMLITAWIQHKNEKFGSKL